MKIVFRLFVFLVVLGALAGAGWYGYQHFYRNAPPGGAGRNMEIRLLALNGAIPYNGTGPGVDVFQKADVSSYIANGDVPNGWKWLPVTNGVEPEITGSAPAGSENPYISRTSNGQMFLLTADSPDMTLTHSADIRPWGVESVEVVTDEQAPGVSIKLDQAGGDLMHDFTQKYLGHRIAVVVGGQICEVALIQSPVRSAIEVRLPAGQLAQAEGLRDSLMK
jgi:preprotein translocase subunit SecD